MPNNVVKSIADEAGISVEKAEKHWDEAKKVVDKEYDDVEKESDQYYKLVTSITKNMVGIKEESVMSFEQKLKETRDNRQKVSNKKDKKHYTGYDNNLNDYKKKNDRPSSYDAYDYYDDIKKSIKKNYNADADANSDYKDRKSVV